MPKTISNVEVFATGTWTDSGGHTKAFTTADLDGMVKNFTDGAVLKAGHSSDSFNKAVAKALGIPDLLVKGEGRQGQVGFGRMTSLERKGNLLLATFADVPDEIAKLVENRLYDSVSSELVLYKDGSYGIQAVALLGAQEPAVSSLHGQLATALVYSYSVFDQPTISDVRPIPGGSNKKKEANNMAGELVEHTHGPDGQATQGPPHTHGPDGNPIGDVPMHKHEAPSGEQTPAAPGTQPAAPEVEAMKKIIAVIGCDPASTPEQVIQAIQALKESAGGPATGNTGPNMAKFAEQDSTIKSLQAKVTILEKDKKTLQFTKRAESWVGIVADIPAEVNALVELSEEAANKVAVIYDRAAEALKKTGFFEAIGKGIVNPDPKQVAADEFTVRVTKYSADNKIGFYDAMLKVSQDDPKAYQEYMTRCRASDFANVPKK